MRGFQICIALVCRASGSDYKVMGGVGGRIGLSGLRIGLSGGVVPSILESPPVQSLRLGVRLDFRLTIPKSNNIYMISGTILNHQ